jgi:hypothetical protein
MPFPVSSRRSRVFHHRGNETGKPQSRLRREIDIGLHRGCVVYKKGFSSLNQANPLRESEDEGFLPLIRRGKKGFFILQILLILSIIVFDPVKLSFF